MKEKVKESVLVAIIIIFVAAIALFFGSRKTDYYIDELWTYGLANNIGSINPDIEFGKEYSGMGPYEDFFVVKSGDGFNYVNVWQNQANDVHPPLYYVFVHTLCSLFPNTFSKWYGIAINLLWMIATSIMLYLLAKEITGSMIASAGIVLAYETSAIYINTLLFIRMYAQVTFFVIAFAYLFKKYWDKKLDKRFYIWFALIVILGMMTHYYFLIIAFALCVSLAIHLIYQKRFAELRTSVFVALGTGVLYLLCWYHFAGHLFRGYRGKEAISAALTFSGLADRIVRMISIINKEAFAGLMIFFVIALLMFIVIKAFKKEKIFDYEAALFLSSLFYIFVGSKIAPMKDVRYVMPVMFALFIAGYNVILYLFKLRLSDKTAESIAIILFLILNCYNFESNGFYIKMDFYSQDKAELLSEIDGNNCIVYIDDLWESLYYYIPLQHSKTYTFVNSDNVETVLDKQEENFILITKPWNIQTVPGELQLKEIYTNGQEAYYMVEK